MTIEITILISVISVSFAVFFGLKNMRRADKDDIEERASKNAEINYKLDQALSLLQAMQEEMRSLSSRLSEDEKMTEILSVKLSELEKRVEKIEKGEK